MSNQAPGPRRIRTIAAIGATAACVAALVVLAAGAPGYAGSSVTATLRTVWVTNPAQLLLGRINRQIDELDSAVALSSDDFDVLQQGRTVFAVDNAAHQLRRVDPATVTLSEPLGLPDDAVVALGGGVLAIGDPATGDLWTRPAAAPGTGEIARTPPAATLAPGLVLAVGPDGTVAATAPGADRLTLIPAAAGGSGGTGGDGATGIDRIDLGRTLSAPGDGATPGSPIGIAMVGSDPIVLDRAAGVLLVPDTRPGADSGAAGGRVRPMRELPLPDGISDPTLQQSGPASTTVLVATASALLSVSLSDGAVERIATGSVGTPAAPVYLDGCMHGAWSGRHPTYLSRCGTASDSRPVIRPIPAAAGGSAHALVFRVNRSEIVLNDVTTGQTYLLDEQMTVVNNWSQVSPPRERDSPQQGDRGDEDASEQATLSRTNCTGTPTPPAAADDRFGVRAGRPAILPVIANDATTDCSVVIIDSVSPLPDGAGRVDIVHGGRALQVTAAADATGPLPPISYRLADGAQRTSRATVQLTVVPPDEHPEPARLRGSAIMVGVGGTVTDNVLDDWYSPAGDPLWLTAVTAQGQDLAVTFAPDGAVTVHGTTTGGPGKRTVSFALTDGRNVAHGTLSVQVVAPSDAAPLASPVYARVPVGRPITLRPLDSVLVPGTEPVRLTAVRPDRPGGGPTIDIDPDTGTVTVTATEPGDYRLQYSVAAGTQSADGAMRIVATDPDADRPPVAVADIGYLAPDRTLRLDLTRNDLGHGMPLAVRALHTDAGSPLQVTISDMHVAHVSARRPLPDGGVWFSYTVSDGTADATGWVHVVPVPAVPGRGPIASPARMTVRAGDAGTLPVSAVAVDPAGRALTVQDFDPRPAGQGLLFADGTDIRFLAPDSTTGEQVSAVYTVTDTAHRAASAPLQITVVPHGTNTAPRTPPAVTARVFAGGTVTVPLPLAGIDPDGDWVTATRITTPGALGGASIVGRDAIRYTALDQAGSDTVRYLAEDPQGKTVTGRVDVVVVPPPEVARPPVAPDLTVAVPPGGSVGVDVLAAVSDPAGSPATFAGRVRVPAGAPITARIVDGLLAVTAGDRPGVAPVTYTVANQRGLTASGVVTVTVTPDAPPAPPTAEDIFVRPDQPADRAVADVVVDIADHVGNPGGPTSDLQVTLPGTGTRSARVSGPLQITVGLTDARQVIAYRVQGPAGLTATAFVVVPHRDAFQPDSADQAAEPDPLRPSVNPLQVQAGETVTVDIGEHITAPGREITVPPGAELSASTGEVRRTDATHLSWSIPDDAPRQAMLHVQVTDGAATAIVPIAATITPAEPPPPEFQSTEITVPAGGSTTVDLAALATPGKPGQQLTFAGLTGAARGVTAELTGATLTVAAAGTATKGTTVPLQVTVSDGSHPAVPATVTVTVVASTAPLAWIADIAVDGRQGVRQRVDVLAGAQNPLPDRGPLTVVGAAVISGTGRAGFDSAGTVTITPGADQVGELVVQVTVADATADPDRRVTGTVTVTVAGAPGRVTGVTVLASSDRTVTLTWQAAPANGRPIEYYQIRATDGSFAQRCDGQRTQCTLTGLTNDVTYRFTVTAHNAIGNSPPSVRSGPARPDAAPRAPAAAHLTFGDRSITATWTPPVSRGSPITGYLVTISPAPPTGPSTVAVTAATHTFRHLTNGTSYQVTVVAQNSSGTNSPSSAPARATPAAPPDRPRAPGLSYDADAGVVTVSWQPVAGHGDDQVTYHVDWTGDDGTHGTLIVPPGKPPSGTIGDAALGVTYRATVTASNKAGASRPSKPGAVRAFTAVGAPGSVQATATGLDGTVAVNWTAPAYSGWDIGGYQYQIDGQGSWVALPVATSAQIHDTALANGVAHTVSIRACTKRAADACGPAATSADVVPFGRPAAVTDLAATVGDGTIALTWSAPDGNGRPIAGYEYSTDDGQTWSDTGQGADTSGVPVSGSNGTEYTVRVRAYHDVQGNGRFANPSNPVTATPYGPIGKPTDLHVSSRTQTSVTFSWSEPENNGLGNPYRYRVNGGDAQSDRSQTFSASCGESVSISVVAVDTAGHIGEPASSSGQASDCPPSYPVEQVDARYGAPTFPGINDLSGNGQPKVPYLTWVHIKCYYDENIIETDGGRWYLIQSGRAAGRVTPSNNFVNDRDPAVPRC